MHIVELPSFFTPYGGEFCLEQAKALQSLGHEVRIISNVQLSLRISKFHFFTYSYHRFWHTVDGIPVFQRFQRGIPMVIRPNVSRWVEAVRAMFRAYVSEHGIPDILHAHCAKWAGYAAMLISEDYHIPYVITEHLPLMLLEDEFGKAPSNAWQINLLRLAYEKAASVFPVSEELVDDIACYYGKQYRWQYISNTIDVQFFAYHQRPPCDGRPFRFCCLADYYYRKGYDVLFPAYQKLQQQGLLVELHVAGLQTDGRECLNAIERLQLRGVKTYGRLNRSDVRNLLYDCDALVLASRSEVQPLVLLEAMSTGIPVVSTECIPRCLRIAEGCLIVPIDDVESLAEAMNSVMEMPVDGKVLSEKVAQMASPEVVGKKLETALLEILMSRHKDA